MENEEQYIPEFEENEKSFQEVLRGVIHTVWDIIRLGLRMWFLLPLLPLLFIFGAYKYTENFQTTFSAKLTFMVNQEASDPIVSGTITPSQIGLGAAGIQAYNFSPEKIRQLSRTNKLMTIVLFQKVIIENKEDFLINHFLRINKLGYGDSYFKKEVPIDSFSREQVGALGYAQSMIRGGNFSLSYDESKIFSIITTTNNEELTYKLAMSFYNSLGDFYIKKTTERAKLTYDFLIVRLDSIKTELSIVEHMISNFDDSHHNLTLSVPLVENERRKQQRAFLNSLYFATLQSFEAAKVNLQNSTPIFQMIDQPSYPLPWDKRTKKIYFILALVVGFFTDILMIIIIWLIKRYGKDTIQFFRDAVTQNDDTGSDDHSAKSI